MQKVLFERIYCIQTIEDNIVSVQVHGFCDGSERAYGCCVYLRILFRSSFVKVVLVSAKSGVSPLRKVTIPRLELLGNFLLPRLISSAINNLLIKFLLGRIPVMLMHGYRMLTKVYKSFIQTRVQLVRGLLSISCWRSVSSHLNPADIISRGFLLNDLVKNEVWFKSPTFLTLPESVWLHFTIGDKFNFDISKEEEKCKINSVYNKDSNAGIQSIAVHSILNNYDKMSGNNPVSDSYIKEESLWYFLMVNCVIQ